MPSLWKCPVALPHGTVRWSAVCDFLIILTFFIKLFSFVFSFFIYYGHKFKHIPFDNTTKVLGTIRTESFERYKNIYCDRQQKQNISNLIKKKRWNLWLFIGCNHITKLTHKFTKFNENSMEAQSQQNFNNNAAIVVNSSRLSLWSIQFQDLV